MTGQNSTSNDTLLEPGILTEDFITHFIKEEQVIKEEPYSNDRIEIPIKEELLHESIEETNVKTEHYNIDSYGLLEPKIELNEVVEDECGFGGSDESSNLSTHFISQHDNPYAIKSKLDPLITNKRKVDQAFNLDSRDSGNILIETNTKNLSVTITAFKCNVCLEVLPSLDELVKHSKICRGEKPFCNSGEKRFHCYECFKVFPTRGSLLAHKNKQRGLCPAQGRDKAGLFTKKPKPGNS